MSVTNIVLSQLDEDLDYLILKDLYGSEDLYELDDLLSLLSKRYGVEESQILDYLNKA